MAPDGIPNLSTDSDEAVTPNWSEFDHQGMAANNVCSQFGTIQPGPDTTAFGVK
jgi:hypothetical protein